MAAGKKMELTPLDRRIINVGSQDQSTDRFAGKLKKIFQEAGITVVSVLRHDKGFTIKVNPETVNKENMKKIKVEILQSFDMYCVRSIICEIASMLENLKTMATQNRSINSSSADFSPP